MKLSSHCVNSHRPGGSTEASLRKTSLILLLSFCMAHAAAPAAAQMRFELVNRSIIEARLKSFARSNDQRLQVMHKLFDEAGCSGAKRSEQPVPHIQQPNIICVLPGTGDAIIIVGAHFDMVQEGDGVVDNWSGAALLPSLYQTLSRRPVTHTYIFIAFSGEEKGLAGSDFYAKKLTKEEKARIHAMVNMDTLGLSSTKIWASRSDKELVGIAAGVADAMKLPIAGVNVEKVGATDSESFASRKIPSITFHSVTQETWPIFHSPNDNIKSIRFEDYYETYRLLTAYLTYLDTYLSRPKEERQPKKKD